MRRAEVAIGVLDLVQMFDQQIRTAWFCAKQCFDFVPCLIGQLAAFGVVTPFAFARFPNAIAVFFRCISGHVLSPHAKSIKN